MAKQRYINTRFWDDGYITELDPIEKLLFLYLLTNPLTEIAGAYEIPLKRMAFDTGIDREMIGKILKRFEGQDKIFYRDGWVFIVNFAKHQSDSPKILAGIQKSIAGCPEWIREQQKISYAYPIDTLSDRDRDRNKNENRDRNLEDDASQAKPTKTSRGTRLPEPFLLTSEMRKWAGERCPIIDPVLETEKFVNYWRSKAGRDATKLDWLATWRNWILTAKGNATNGNGKSNVQLSMEAAERVKAKYREEEQNGKT